MATLSELNTRLAALKAARDSGALIVKHGNTSTTFRSLSEIEQIIAALEAEITDAGVNTYSRVRYSQQLRKGL